MDIEPNKTLKANFYTREEDAWPSQVCQSAREGIEETVVVVAATKIRAASGRQRLSTGNIRLTLGILCRIRGQDNGIHGFSLKKGFEAKNSWFSSF